MNLRPQVQLRFRSMKQFEMTKAAAREVGESVNEYILLKLEVGDVSGEVSSGVRGSVEERRGKRGIGGVRSAYGKKASGESSAVDGGAQADRSREGKGEKEKCCPKCGKELREWGGQMNCEGCRQNFEK